MFLQSFNRIFLQYLLDNRHRREANVCGIVNQLNTPFQSLPMRFYIKNTVFNILLTRKYRE